MNSKMFIISIFNFRKIKISLEQIFRNVSNWFLSKEEEDISARDYLSYFQKLIELLEHFTDLCEFLFCNLENWIHFQNSTYPY